MTPSTTNTAARELIAFLLGEAPLDGVWFGEPHPSGRPYWWRKRLSATLTQQQGGEQEAGDGLPEFPEPHGYIDVQGLATEKNSTNFRMLLESHRNGKPRWSERLTLIYTADQMRAYATAALRTKQPEASEGDGRTFDRGVRAAQDVVRALCCHYQEEMKYPDCSISYLSDLEEVTQGLFWEIDKLLDKTCGRKPR